MNKLPFLIALLLSLGIMGCEDKEETKNDKEVVETGKLEEFKGATYCMTFNYLLTREDDTLYLSLDEKMISLAKDYKGEIVTIYGTKRFLDLESESCPPVVFVKKITEK